MNPLDFPLLADENIHPEVVRFLVDRGYDVQSVAEQDLFGTLTIAQGEPFTGIVYLRPGHIRPEFTVETLETIAAQTLDVRPPFIVVAARSEQTVRIRVRQL